MRATGTVLAIAAVVGGIILTIVAIVDIAIGSEGMSMWVALVIGIGLAVLGLPGLGNRSSADDGWGAENPSKNALDMDKRNDR